MDPGNKFIEDLSGLVSRDVAVTIAVDVLLHEKITGSNSAGCVVIVGCGRCRNQGIIRGVNSQQLTLQGTGGGVVFADVGDGFRDRRCTALPGY